MRSTLRCLRIVRFAALGLLIVGCTFPVTTAGGGSGKGSLVIGVTNTINARTLVPSIDMNAASYTVSGTGPNSETFTATTTGAAVTENALSFGGWTIVVNALDAAGIVIGTGSATARVDTGQTNTVSVTVTPISGTGELSLTVTWPASQVQTPSVIAPLRSI